MRENGGGAAFFEDWGGDQFDTGKRCSPTSGPQKKPSQGKKEQSQGPLPYSVTSSPWAQHRWPGGGHGTLMPTRQAAAQEGARNPGCCLSRRPPPSQPQLPQQAAPSRHPGKMKQPQLGAGVCLGPPLAVLPGLPAPAKEQEDGVLTTLPHSSI